MKSKHDKGTKVPSPWVSGHYIIARGDVKFEKDFP